MWRYLTSRILGYWDESAYGLRRIRGVYLMPRRIRAHAYTHTHTHTFAHIYVYMHKERKLGMSNRCSWIKLRAFRAENVSGSAMLSATTVDTTIVPHATRRSVVNTRTQGFYKSAVVSSVRTRFLKMGRSVLRTRAYTRVASPACAFASMNADDKHCGQKFSVFTAITRVCANNVYDDSGFRSIEIVSRESSTTFRCNESPPVSAVCTLFL